MSRCTCIGWWQQEGYGRQPMHQLQIFFQQSLVTGSGVDMIAPFTLSGNLRLDATVEFVKQYTGRHTVLYVGQYDGEGTFYGTWDIDGCRGQWSIKVVQPERSDSADELYDEVK
ncbi:MAG: hypothetical protein ABI557_06670 [Aureliella sp.]